jgi:flagellin-like hook-associated protein FlgL
MEQYNEMLTQINDVITDSGYKGVNLLNDEDLTIKFSSTGELVINGFNAKTTGDLNLSVQTDWSINGNIQAAMDEIAATVDVLKSKSSILSSNLSIVNIRQDFTSAMINTLTEGADQLTVADVNEEGANMLMLQTRQALSTTSLSLAAQSSQSVLRLFQ